MLKDSSNRYHSIFYFENRHITYLNVTSTAKNIFSDLNDFLKWIKTATDDAKLKLIVGSLFYASKRSNVYEFMNNDIKSNFKVKLCDIHMFMRYNENLDELLIEHDLKEKTNE